MRLRFGILLLLLPLIAVAQNPLVIKNVTLVDGSGGPPTLDATVLVVNGRIALIGEGGTLQITDGYPIVDGTGKTLVPGIINLHGHVGLTKGLVQAQENYSRANVIDNLRTYASYGVTTTTSLGTDMEPVIAVRDDIDQGNLPGLARVRPALYGFTTPDGYPTKAPGVKGLALEVSNAAEARRQVDRLADSGAELVKMWVDSHHGAFLKLSPHVSGAIIRQAHQRGLLAVAHLYELSDAKVLVDAGLDVIVHSVRDTDVDRGLIRRLLARGVTYCPTLTREQSTYVYADSPKWLDDPFFTRGVDEGLVQELRTTLRDTQRNDPELEINRENFRMAMRNLKTLSDAGVKIGFGTDTGPPARFAGYFEHWEAELMVEAGLT
ncbi:MAG: amidohydrolase family protein, partial [Bryobacterales bacterium]|nr:amidohydrolase family protein [Bryobacterales bacterium]MDE0624034.1 amidohydrolase family protein [Bryobacterales bacterium]